MSKTFNDENYFILNNYHKIPKIGLGTFNSTELTSIAKQSINLGYRLFDTSPAYRTEKPLAKGLWNHVFSSVDRKSCYITTKLFLNCCFDNSEYKGLKKSLKQLHTEYIDNYLLHWAHPDVFIKNYKEIHESESIKNPVIPGYEVIYRVIKICSSLQKCKKTVSQIDGLNPVHLL